MVNVERTPMTRYHTVIQMQKAKNHGKSHFLLLCCFRAQKSRLSKKKSVLTHNKSNADSHACRSTDAKISTPTKLPLRKIPSIRQRASEVYKHMPKDKQMRAEVGIHNFLRLHRSPSTKDLVAKVAMEKREF